jgi:hypothetical protein
MGESKADVPDDHNGEDDGENVVDKCGARAHADRQEVAPPEYEPGHEQDH